jgi:N-hydroxyarylamine O-acetyltransferase
MIACRLDIHTGTRIVLDTTLLYRKIVTMKRGGFCYELNALFDWLLRELGYNSKLLMGKVYDHTTGDYGPEFDHMLSLVEIDGRQWLADVGFGEFSMGPLELRLHHPQTDAAGDFLIEQDNNEYFKVSKYSQKENRYTPEYAFSTKEVRLADFSEMCLYYQTSPQSHFTRRKVCSIATAAGRITLTDDKLIKTINGLRTESLIRNRQEFNQALAQYFSISIPPIPSQTAGETA